MSYGMPKSYDAWRTQGPPEYDHFKQCPCHDDAEDVCKCGCPSSIHKEDSSCLNGKDCLCEGWFHDDRPDCICADLED